MWKTTLRFNKGSFQAIPLQEKRGACTRYRLARPKNCRIFRLTLDPFTTLFFMTCSIGIIAIIGLSYVASRGRAEMRFALVVSLLLIVLFFALSPLHLTCSDTSQAGRQPSTDLHLGGKDIHEYRCFDFRSQATRLLTYPSG